MVAPHLTRIIDLEVQDIRFPTSRHLDGSDAMNPDPDYAAAYVVVHTDSSDGLSGHSLAFTVGRGNAAQVSAIQLLRSYVVGRSVDQVCDDLGGFNRALIYDSPLRWLGPEKGIMHMAIGAVTNAAWDLAARRAGKPVWKFLSDMSPEQLVDIVDWRYLEDALTRDEALCLLRSVAGGRAEREVLLRATGYPAYTTSPGWLGYDDAKLEYLAKNAIAEGFSQIKLKVGANIDDDVRRLGIARRAVGNSVRIALDANQIWDVATSVPWINALRPFDPYWIEEPTSPDDILGHASIRRSISPIKVATGEHVANRIMFKQLLQANAVDIIQIDASRVGGINENVAILLLARKFGVPVCPHAGGVGLCEMVQHLAMFDFIAVSGSLEDRSIEYIDHLHEHFVEPVIVDQGHYVVPTAPGLSAEMQAESRRRYTFPDGPEWKP